MNIDQLHAARRDEAERLRIAIDKRQTIDELVQLLWTSRSFIGEEATLRHFKDAFRCYVAQRPGTNDQ